MFNCFRQGREIARQSEATPLATQEEKVRSQIRRPEGPEEKEFLRFPTFGPLYSTKEDPIYKGYKNAAWEHVLEKTEGNESEIKETYLLAIRQVEAEAKRTYVDGTMDQSDPDFRWMMLMDGCFLLQLVILLLGGSSALEYRENHAIFGRKKIEKERWLNSIFHVGNQIPLVVLDKLKKQSFFKGLLKKVKFEEPKDMCMRALYHLLLERSKERPSDLLHGLHSLVIGKENPTKDNEEDIDMELGDDQDADKDDKFLSAKEVSQAGIYFNKAKGMACRNIHFKSYKIFSLLSIPTFTVDDKTELLFQFLQAYEKVQRRKGHKQEVCAYLKFMSLLIQTKEDVKLLASEGIIEGDPIHKEKLPTILSKLAAGESSRNLRHLRLEINEYSQPDWQKYVKYFSVGVFLITLVQTILAILSFQHDLKCKN